MLAPTVSCVPVAKQESRDSPGFKIPRGREQRPRNVLRRRPSGSAKSLKEKRDKMASPADEKRRSFDLDDRPPVPPKPEWSYKNSGSAPQTPTTPVVQTRALREDGNADSPLFDSPIQTQSQANQFVEHPSTPLHVSRRSPTPHYTVYGTPAERRIPACGPDDCWTGPDVLIPPEQRRRPKTHTHVRTLSRKVSAQWKKVTGGIVASDNSPSPLGHKTGHSKGRPSLQEWSRGRSKERTRFTGRSMDGLAALSGEDEVWAGSAAVRERSFTDPSAEQTESKDSEGGKLWRLVKRISTGSLRERVNAEKDHAVPPLPAIPRELLHRASHGGHSKQSVDTTAPKARVLPPSSRRRRSSSLDKQPGVQSSIATSSSSPNSSDVASTKFFPRPYSARSSISSYGEVEMPRVTELDRHIISPLEQLRLGGDIEPGADITPSRSPRRRSASVPPGPPNDANIDRPLCSAAPPAGLGDTSTGSASNHTLLADGGVSLSPPPPRPPHARLRTSNGSGPGSPTSSKHAGERVSEVSIHTRISSTGRDSLEQSYFRAQMTFRELNAPRRPPLTEREKSDIWDNLLARSEQAGGTLHISGGELMSDSLRLSTYSEMSLKSVCDVPSQRTSLSP
ncbi:hypothetical protein ID866_4997 [Astraeus odoratus]|nr:hypothetical protein ID866_4997 [Astraeus odoratus]